MKIFINKDKLLPELKQSIELGINDYIIESGTKIKYKIINVKWTAKGLEVEYDKNRSP